MADWVSNLCDKEDLESKKRSYVAGLSQRIFEALKKEVENCVGVYNKRHPQDLGIAPVTIDPYDEKNVWHLKIKKITKPSGDMDIAFPINDAGSMCLERRHAQASLIALIPRSRASSFRAETRLLRASISCAGNEGTGYRSWWRKF